MSGATSHRLITTLLTLAEEKGMDGQTLAERSGLRPETISRIKTRGTADLETLASLASAVGKTIDLVDEDSLIQRLRNKTLLGA